MNNINFRGKRLDNGQWAYGGYIYSEQSKKHIIGCYQTIKGFNTFGLLEVDGSTVGQCTERKDIEDKHIYEEDIVEIEAEGQIYKAVVRWDNVGTYYLEPYDDDWIADWNFQDDIEKFKVIGNVHEVIK